MSALRTKPTLELMLADNKIALNADWDMEITRNNWRGEGGSFDCRL